jgi:hypothetical protein
MIASSVPLYRVSLSLLAPEDRMTVTCAGCRHFALLTPAGERGGAPDADPDLEPRMRCTRCNEFGRGMVSVEWADPG